MTPVAITGGSTLVLQAAPNTDFSIEKKKIDNTAQLSVIAQLAAEQAVKNAAVSPEITVRKSVALQMAGNLPEDKPEDTPVSGMLYDPESGQYYNPSEEAKATAPLIIEPTSPLDDTAAKEKKAKEEKAKNLRKWIFIALGGLALIVILILIVKRFKTA